MTFLLNPPLLCQYLSFRNDFFNRFLNRLCQYLSFVNTYFNRFSPVEKAGVAPHCLSRDSLASIPQYSHSIGIYWTLSSEEVNYTFCIIYASQMLWALSNCRTKNGIVQLWVFHQKYLYCNWMTIQVKTG